MGQDRLVSQDKGTENSSMSQNKVASNSVNPLGFVLSKSSTEGMLVYNSLHICKKIIEKAGKFGQTTLYNYNQSRLLYSTKTLRFLVIAHWWVCLSGGFFHPSVSSLNIIAF